MIYTITFNPALDYIVSVEDFQFGRTNRTASEMLLAGGKGINVSIVLKNLGISSTALGFIAGFTGKEIASRVEKAGIRTEFIELAEGCSRINLKLKNVDGTEINGKGPDIDRESLEKLLGRLELLKQDDVLVLAGSIPASLPDSIYQEILARLAGRGVITVVDAAGQLLLNVLEWKPFLVKPNQQELEELFDVKLTTVDEIIPYAKKVQEKGARNVLVSMGGKGALLVAENGQTYYREAPKGKVKNSVGAGDSMVAGFLAGWLTEKDYEKAFCMGLAAGSASAFSENLAEKEEVEKLLLEEVEKLLVDK